MTPNYKMLRNLLVAAGVIWTAIPAWAGDYRITHLDLKRVFPGVTLLADMSDPRAPRVVEVDFNGNILWKFLPANVGRGALLDAAYLDNGHILITITGHGILEIDRAGMVVWQHLDPGASHDADRLKNGNTLYNLGWRQKGEDVVREIDPSGRVVWYWNGLADYDRVPFANIESEGWMHVNAVTRLANGNTLVSMRNFNTVAEVGRDGRVVREWTFRGKDRRTGVQTEGLIVGERNHEPEILDNGHMLVALRRPNRFVEFDLATQKIVWSWTHPDGEHELDINREANRLPNGNTLGSAGNKLIEIAPDGAIVWQMLAPDGKDRNTRKFHKAIRRSIDGKAYGD